MLKFPYAIRDFKELILEDYLYLDRTQHIRFVEDWGKELLFLRPRRFGKSLWLSTLMTYYDVAKADDFERLFGHLAIGQDPTPLHNQYLVMRWDFSRVSAQGSLNDIQLSLSDHINNRIERFREQYKTQLTIPVEIEPGNAFISFERLMTAIAVSDHKLYLFVDEYDNFANEVFMVSKVSDGLSMTMGTREYEERQQKYIELVKGEGIFKTLFKNLKSAGSGDGLDRVFMTGVSPIVLSDVTSGANTFKDITWRHNLNDLCGFNEAEVQEMLEQVMEECELDNEEGQAEKILEQMRRFYNGSRFVTFVRGQALQDIPRVYNPTLTFYFLEEFQDSCGYPEEMLDGNLEPDGKKLAYIAGQTQGRPLLMDALQGQGYVAVSTLRKRFGIQDFAEDDQQREHLAILLTYLGSLTVSGRNETGGICLEIPNLVMRRLYAEQALQMMTQEKAALLTQAQNVAEHLLGKADLLPLCTFVEDNLLSVFDNRDYREFDELTLKSLFISMLYYKSTYVMDSEPAIQRRYGDLIMMLRPGMRDMGRFDFLFEFKYVKLKDAIVDKKPLSGEEVSARSQDELLKIEKVKSEIDEAKTQLKIYRQKLQRKYGAALKLRSFAVVGVGLERIIFEEVV